MELDLNVEHIVDCGPIYKTLEENVLLGMHKQGCCYDINAEQCEKFIIAEDGYCVCDKTNLDKYKKKYLKHKLKYNLIKNWYL